MEKELKIIYQDKNVLVIDKPAGINSDDFQKRVHPVKPSAKSRGIPLEAELFNRVHRLDKDTSGILLIAKNNKALEFLQKQFQERKVIKKYTALIVGNLKNKKGEINTLLGRSPQNRKKQKVYLPCEPDSEGKRIAITKYKVLQKFDNYTLIEVKIETGRKHQIRAHFAFLSHPIAGDKMYGFKNQPCPKELNRQFLHASYLEITLPNGERKIFRSKLPKELKEILEKLKAKDAKCKITAQSIKLK